MKLKILAILLILTSVPAFPQIYTYNNQIKLNWDLEYTLPGKDKSSKVKATIPGAIQLDIAKAENYKPYYEGSNFLNYSWMEDKAFLYRTTFKDFGLADDMRLYFCSKGIDYKFELWINGNKLHSQEGMFTPVYIDITDYIEKNNEILLYIDQVPKSHKEPADRSQASNSVKPAVSYGWDWHPRLIPSGIWGETYLEVRPSSHIDYFYTDYILSNDLKKVDLSIEIEGKNLKGQEIIWKLRDASERVVASKILICDKDNMTITSSANDINLWWPHDHGDQYMYTSIIELRSPENRFLQEFTKKIGFRKVEMVMNEGAWKEPTAYPMSRSAAPAQLVINNRKIFAKGTNWVNPEIFPGKITEQRYNELTDRAIEANFNILRVWGGGIINKEAFYEQCDQKGLLVWQEFPLACNNYPDTPEYLAVLKQEATSIVKRLRRHTSVILWSGGNELFNSWSGMNDQSKALRMLNSICFTLDPNTPFIPTSPLEGMGHGHYVFRDPDTKEEVYSLMKRSHFTAYTEFGIPSPSSVNILRSFMSIEELWPPKRGTSWETHHGYNAWRKDSWLMQDMIEDYFGRSNNINDLTNNGQLLQSEGYKAVYEEARRQKPYCSMALNWCFNEPWPTAANNSIINWPNNPKPAFYAVGESCRPVLASGRIEKLKWKEGEFFSSDIFLLNDSYNEIEPGTIIVSLRTNAGETEILRWNYGYGSANTNIPGPTARFQLPHWNLSRFYLDVKVEGHPEYNSTYMLLYETKGSEKSATNKMNK